MQKFLHHHPKIQYSKRSKDQVACIFVDNVGFTDGIVNTSLYVYSVNLQTQSNPGMEKKGFEIQYYKDINIILNNSSFCPSEQQLA
jgi:hypothetical protein